MRTVLVANRKGGVGKTVAAITIATALAARGERVALADADGQKSALRWLKHRPDAARPVAGLDWSHKGDVGDAPRGVDWLVVDAPGALRGDRAAALIAEADLVVAPVLPSIFDLDSTRRFLREIEGVKRVRKGKVPVHLLANRVRAQSRGRVRLQAFFDDLGHAPVAWISERAAYAELAEGGLGVFDKPQPIYRALCAQWQPLLDAMR